LTRLLVHVEGQTEEQFVNEVLAPYLYNVGYTLVSPRLVGAARSRIRRGGICGWPTAKNEIYKHLSGDKEALATTFVDFYALPKSGSGLWPGRDNCDHLLTLDKPTHVAARLMDDFSSDYAWDVSSRFIPYVAMHEFEALLFSHPERMASAFGRVDLAPHFQNIRDLYPTPEHINDSPQTAPSKRIIGLMPKYDKVLMGNLAAIDITLDTMRAECAGFNSWLEALENAA